MIAELLWYLNIKLKFEYRCTVFWVASVLILFHTTWHNKDTVLLKKKFPGKWNSYIIIYNTRISIRNTLFWLFCLWIFTSFIFMSSISWAWWSVLYVHISCLKCGFLFHLYPKIWMVCYQGDLTLFHPRYLPFFSLHIWLLLVWAAFVICMWLSFALNISVHVLKETTNPKRDPRTQIVLFVLQTRNVNQ